MWPHEEALQDEEVKPEEEVKKEDETPHLLTVSDEEGAEEEPVDTVFLHPPTLRFVLGQFAYLSRPLAQDHRSSSMIPFSAAAVALETLVISGWLDPHSNWLFGLVAWFSLGVREVLGSFPRTALLPLCNKKISPSCTAHSACPVRIPGSQLCLAGKPWKGKSARNKHLPTTRPGDGSGRSDRVRTDAVFACFARAFCFFFRRRAITIGKRSLFRQLPSKWISWQILRDSTNSILTCDDVWHLQNGEKFAPLFAALFCHPLGPRFRWRFLGLRALSSICIHITFPVHLQFLFHTDCDSNWSTPNTLLVIASYLCVGPVLGQRWLSLRCWTTDPKRGASALKRCSGAKNMSCLVAGRCFWAEEMYENMQNLPMEVENFGGSFKICVKPWICWWFFTDCTMANHHEWHRHLGEYSQTFFYIFMHTHEILEGQY